MDEVAAAETVGAVLYAQQYDIYSVRSSGRETTMGLAARSCGALLRRPGRRPLGARVPWQGTAADIFVQAQFPMHSGRILGLPGRVLISLMGIVVAALSVTGVVIWYRKRRARLSAQAKSQGRSTEQVLAAAE